MELGSGRVGVPLGQSAEAGDFGDFGEAAVLADTGVFGDTADFGVTADFGEIGEFAVGGVLLVLALCALGLLTALPGVWVVIGVAAGFLLGDSVGSAAGRVSAACATYPVPPSGLSDSAGTVKAATGASTKAAAPPVMIHLVLFCMVLPN
ncbi:hypothetical protein [Microlunatus speluncae]|uniref:hypothetical protein n=1 Tax=Microlunatus speluncae TaxID=2594267 RepID=UPI0012667012|nr:hypothetical protein [Microlunatus speluncae]